MELTACICKDTCVSHYSSEVVAIDSGRDKLIMTDNCQLLLVKLLL